jgi:aminopeptidase N
MGVSDVAANNEAAYYTLGGTNESILSVSLPGEIAPGGSAEIYLRFEIGLPATGNRFGVNETGIMLGNFLPIAAVYENGAWREDGYTREGDAFYSECADYRVSVSAPAKWELAHTGSLVESKEENGVSTWYIAAPKSRDFALALMKEPYVETRQSAAGTAVTAFGTSKKRAVYSADAAVAALDYFSRNIGTYPYDTFFVVPFDMGGGMEYPGLVMLCERDLHGDDLSGAALVIGHEAAHQWFYSVVGSDQINAPWLDESLVEFLGFDFLRAYLGDEAAFARREARYGSLEGYKRTKRIDSALYDFAGSEYFLIVYASGCAMYDELYRELGRDAFFEALATYFNANSFFIADRDDLVAAFSETAGGDMARWFEQRLAVPS